MTSASTITTRVRTAAAWRLKEQLVRRRRVPRYAYRHYFIETDGLHSRIHMQNFYSAMWPHLRETVRVNVEFSDVAGKPIGRLSREMAPFGGLFLEVGEALAELESSAEEGTVLVDAEPPRRILDDLVSFPIDEPSTLLMGTPFWMAYYDGSDNYMYVHSISPEMSGFRGVPKAVGRMLIHDEAQGGARWRAGRLVAVDGLEELQLVLINHAGDRRTTRLGIYSAVDDAAVWEERLDLGAHEVRRLRVPREALDEFRRRSPGAHVRAGLDPLPTSNGKPYLLLRYADGPLSLHHG